MKNKSIILGGAICFILFLELLIGRWYAVSNPNAIPLKKESATAVDNFEIKEYQENKTSNSVDNKRLIETGKYCYIVIPRNDTKLYIWSFLKASYQPTDTFLYIKTNIYDKNKKIERIFFDGGHTLYINESSLQYNGKNYDIGKYLNVFVENDHLVLGRFIPLFK